MPRREIERGHSPLSLFFTSFFLFSKVLMFSFILQILLFFFSNPLIENEIKIKCENKSNYDIREIKKWYNKKNIKEVKINEEDGYLVIKYWQKGLRSKYLIPDFRAFDICRISKIYLSKNLVTSIYSSSNLYIFLFSFQIILLFFNIFYFFKKQKSLIILKSIKISFLLYIIACSSLIIMLGILWEKFVTKTFSDYLFNSIMQLANKDKIIFLVFGSILAPLNEEIFFRGILLGQFLKYGFKISGIFTSSILFAVIHFDLLAFPIILIFGVLLAYFYIKSKSILTPIISHILNNSLFFVLTFIS